MAGQFDTVIAGSKAFALALFAPLTERVGTRPRIAADPAQAAALLPDAGLVIVELQSPAWLAEVKQLVASRPGLRIVAALPKGAEAAAAPLQAIGVESAAWVGAAAALLPAIDRALGREGGAGAAPPPVQAAPPATKPAPVVTPAAVAVTPPASKPAPVLAPAPIAAAPPTTKPAPVLTPAPIAAAPPATRPAIVPPIAPAAPAPRSAIAAPPASQALFDGLDDAEFDVDVDDAGVAADPFGDPFASSQAAVAIAYSPTATWPANAPSLELAEEALLAAMDGVAPPIPAIAAVAQQVAGALSEVEETALARRPLAFDGEPIRRAAAMRVRVGVAFASAPPPGANSDSAAVAAMLAEIDDLLSEVNALAASAPLEVAPALGACRNALVKEAIDFSEAAQRYVAVEVQAAAADSAPRKRAAGARVVSDARITERERKEESRQRRVWIMLAISVAAAAAYHGWEFVRSRQDPGAGPPTLGGLPAGATGIEAKDGEVKLMMAKPGEALDPEAIRKFKEDEQLKGRVVKEVAPGVFSSSKAGPAPKKEGSP